jgi:hypothetical protein
VTSNLTGRRPARESSGKREPAKKSLGADPVGEEGEPGSVRGNRLSFREGFPSGVLQSGDSLRIFRSPTIRGVPERPQFFDRSGLAAEFIQDDKLALSIGVEARLNVSTMVKYAKLYGNLLAPNSRNKSSTRRFTRAFRSNIARAFDALFIATSSSLLDLTGLKSRCSSADLASSSNPAFFVSSVSQIAF